MCTKATKTARKATSKKNTPTPRAVRLDNVVCPRCDGPIYSCPVRWLFCLGCSKPSVKPITMSARTARPIPFTLANATHDCVNPSGEGRQTCRPSFFTPREALDMARKSAPWWRAGRTMWYVQVRGKQIGLGVTDPNDRAGALAAVTRLLAESEPPPLDPLERAAQLAGSLIEALQAVPAFERREWWADGLKVLLAELTTQEEPPV